MLSPYRARAARARHLFVASLQDGEFPGGDTGDPLLGDERRRRLGIAALVRQDQAIEERYLFHACACRPTERLWLCWRSSDEEGRPATRSPFVDEVLDLLAPGPDEAEERLKRVHGLDRVVFEPSQAPGPRELSRALAARGPRIGEDLPGPLADPGVLAQLERREQIGPGTIESWIECPYRWFVDHELRPQRLEPEPDQLTTGSIVHKVLERLYSEPPGDDRIPRPGDLARWRRRAASLLDEEAERRGLEPGMPRTRILTARMRAQIERLLDREARGETELRPALLEASFGDDRDGDVPSLGLEGLRIHGQIDRVDVTPDGRFGVVHDYKTGSKAWAAAKLADEGKLQLQLYARALRELWGIEPIGGLYHRLGARGDPRPRGFMATGIEATQALELVGTDRLEPDEVEDLLDAGESRAKESVAAMLGGPDRPGPERRLLPALVPLPADLPARALDRRGGGRGQRRRGRKRSGMSAAARPQRSTRLAGAHSRAAGGDRGALRRRVHGGGGGHRQDQGSGGALLRRRDRGRRRARRDPRFHVHRASGGRAPGADPAPAHRHLARGLRGRRARAREGDRSRRAGGRAGLDHDHARLLPPPARHASGCRSHGPALPRPRRVRGRKARRAGVRGRAGGGRSKPATKAAARFAAGFHPLRLRETVREAHDRLRSQGVDPPRLPDPGPPGSLREGRRARPPSWRGPRPPWPPTASRRCAPCSTPTTATTSGSRRSAPGRTSRTSSCAPWSCCKSPGAVGAAWRERFEHLMVDEFQDTNGVQLALIDALRGPANSAVRGRRRVPVDLPLPSRRPGGVPPAPARGEPGSGGLWRDRSAGTSAPGRRSWRR